MEHYNTVIIGAGAAGLMCAAHAGPNVLVIDHAKAPGEKIRISGGGRCNFTNMYAEPENFLSQNPHFAKSALSRYTQWDFIALVAQHGIAYHEKTLGQLFCDNSAKEIIAMLLAEMAPAELWLNTSVRDISHNDGFTLRLQREGQDVTVTTRNLVVACGGKSIPKMGASSLGYHIAGQFGHALTDTRPALVPLIFGDKQKEAFRALAGIACDAKVSGGEATFNEAVLFTHRGMSGPAILQISSYWRETQAITVDLAPGVDVFGGLREVRASHGRVAPATALAEVLPKRLAQDVADRASATGNIADMTDVALQKLANAVQEWELYPIGTEGYRTAEVTLGGVDTDGINARTMESKTVPGLYFIGEVVDVTGWLGGYNFQWAWSSGWAAGQAIRGA